MQDFSGRKCLFLLCSGSISEPCSWSRAHGVGHYAKRQQQDELCPNQLHLKQERVVLNCSSRSDVGFSLVGISNICCEIASDSAVVLEVQPLGLSEKVFLNVDVSPNVWN